MILSIHLNKFILPILAFNIQQLFISRLLCLYFMMSFCLAYLLLLGFNLN